jgi:hypothetical protein
MFNNLITKFNQKKLKILMFVILKISFNKIEAIECFLFSLFK